jgi:hypothetical protein
VGLSLALPLLDWARATTTRLQGLRRRVCQRGFDRFGPEAGEPLPVLDHDRGQRPVSKQGTGAGGDARSAQCRPRVPPGPRPASAHWSRPPATWRSSLRALVSGGPRASTATAPAGSRSSVLPKRPSAFWIERCATSSPPRKGKQEERRLSFPKCKKKGRCRDSFHFRTGVRRSAGTTFALPRSGVPPAPVSTDSQRSWFPTLAAQVALLWPPHPLLRPCSHPPLPEVTCSA